MQAPCAYPHDRGKKRSHNKSSTNLIIRCSKNPSYTRGSFWVEAYTGASTRTHFTSILKCKSKGPWEKDAATCAAHSADQEVTFLFSLLHFFRRLSLEDKKNVTPIVRALLAQEIHSCPGAVYLQDDAFLGLLFYNFEGSGKGFVDSVQSYTWKRRKEIKLKLQVMKSCKIKFAIKKRQW